jgi:predicted nucleic acid-binding protein
VNVPPSVLDASVFVAAMSPYEVHHARAKELWLSPQRFLVPALFRVEVLAAMTRRGEPPAVVDAIAALARSHRFTVVPVDDALVDRACLIAKTAKIRGYDAIYAATESLHDAPLLTFDQELGARLQASWPSVTVVR